MLKTGDLLMKKIAESILYFIKASIFFVILIFLAAPLLYIGVEDKKALTWKDYLVFIIVLAGNVLCWLLII